MKDKIAESPQSSPAPPQCPTGPPRCDCQWRREAANMWCSSVENCVPKMLKIASGLPAAPQFLWSLPKSSPAALQCPTVLPHKNCLWHTLPIIAFQVENSVAKLLKVAQSRLRRHERLRPHPPTSRVPNTTQKFLRALEQGHSKLRAQLGE